MAEEKKGTASKSAVVKKLKATKAASVYQKQWFFGMKERVEREGGDFAVLNADVPMEIFRAMDIPFVVNQWWAAICGAKRMTRKYFGLMQENGYRPDLNSYDAQALAESFDPDDKKVDADGNPMGPWGGLPTPTISITRLTGDVQSKIFGLLAENYGADLYVIENTIARTTPLNWYELAADRWEEMYDTDRLDLAVEELKELIRWLEMKTGKMMDINKLEYVMNLINEQEGYYKKTRDLIASCHPVPVTVVDTINAVMQAQWQRGTEWAVEHAKSLYEEVKALADAGVAAVPRSDAECGRILPSIRDLKRNTAQSSCGPCIWPWERTLTSETTWKRTRSERWRQDLSEWRTSSTCRRGTAAGSSSRQSRTISTALFI